MLALRLVEELLPELTIARSGPKVSIDARVCHLFRALRASDIWVEFDLLVAGVRDVTVA